MMFDPLQSQVITAMPLEWRHRQAAVEDPRSTPAPTPLKSLMQQGEPDARESVPIG